MGTGPGAGNMVRNQAPWPVPSSLLPQVEKPVNRPVQHVAGCAHAGQNRKVLCVVAGESLKPPLSAFPSAK